LANAPAALAKLDKNGDGQITLDELRPARPADAPQPAANAPKHPHPPILEALDTDGDGVISAAELANASASLAKLDKNGDGKLTPDEFMGGPRGEGRGPRGPRGPGGPGRGPRPDAPKQ
jgi:Ca2+-binding EF-hand superfamily protein